MGLTFQRTIRALERYGHHTESVMVGQKLTDAILSFDNCATNSSHCHFTLQVRNQHVSPVLRLVSLAIQTVQYLVLSTTVNCVLLTFDADRCFHVSSNVGAVVTA